MFHDDLKFSHMIYRFNTMITMIMGEVNIDPLVNHTSTNHTTPFREEFWLETDFSAHAIFFSFCCFVSVVVFNILTAFAIKVKPLHHLHFYIYETYIFSTGC